MHRRHSDDPLISGAIDDNQNEFNPIKSRHQTLQSSVISPSPQVISATHVNNTSATNTTSARKKVSRTRRKGQFKLRFHHQALPQEYLDHYEATQNSLQKREAEQIKANKAAAAANSSMEVNDHLQAARTHDSVRNWLQKISEFQNEAATVAAAANASTAASHQPISAMSMPAIKLESDQHIMLASTDQIMTVAPLGGKKPTRVVSYNDLPYMGEMTLDNSKPRRGRKPKKADICHLIYKNYGTILPGTPKDMRENNEKAANADILIAEAKKSEVQSKLIGSLLEKRLSNENKARQSPVKTAVSSIVKIVDGKQQAEPLNLCVRDRSDTLTVSSGDEDTESCFPESNRTSPLIQPSETDALLAANLKMSLPNFQSALLDQPTPENPSTADTRTASPSHPPGYVYWPGAGVFIHPMALYYQKMVDAGGTQSPTMPIMLPSTSSTPSTTGTNSTPAVSPMPMASPSPPSHHRREATAKILIPKNISQLLKQEKILPILSNSTVPASNSTAMSEVSSAGSSKSSTPVPQKRKRSAIFIPPMPVESSSNHATEVSICKFKFTGGAKPSLQEKKMLSVDSGGNFRYYSGTGDKSMRGYEFFPRESLQQSSLLSGSSACAFLSTPGEKIDLPPPSHGLSNEVLQIPELPSPATAVVSVASPLGLHHHQSALQVPSGQNVPCQSRPGGSTSATSAGHTSDRRKRKSRRSLHREKLEKTFKEKGFLIQTQQLESAEGATYCKFRQLRKFTRYLFRSWKDYLPGDLQQGQQQSVGVDAAGPAICPSMLQAATAVGSSSGSGTNAQRSSAATAAASSSTPSTFNAGR